MSQNAELLQERPVIGIVLLQPVGLSQQVLEVTRWARSRNAAISVAGGKTIDPGGGGRCVARCR